MVTIIPMFIGLLLLYFRRYPNYHLCGIGGYVIHGSHGDGMKRVNKRRWINPSAPLTRTIVTMALVVIAITSSVIMITTPPEISAIDSIYEAVSAFGTD